MNNFYANSGFTNGTYTIMSYSGVLSGTTPVIGTAPSGYQCSEETNLAGVVKLLALAPPPAPGSLTAIGADAAVHLSWSSMTSATNYNVKRGLVGGGPYSIIANGQTNLNYTDAHVTNGIAYFYAVSGVNGAGEGANSIQAGAIPHSSAPVSVTTRFSGTELQLSWPSDHTGWTLQTQTNDLGKGIGTNWVNVPGSNATNFIQLPINPGNGSVFFRLSNY